MSDEYSYGSGRGRAPKKPSKPNGPTDPRGTPSTGRIVKLLVGQGYGYIRQRDEDIYFHRADVDERTGFNALKVGDAVSFERLDNAVSGARALRVTRRS